MKLSYSRRLDTWTALLVFGLVLFGVIMIYSASVIVAYNLYGDERFFVKKQLVSAVVGLVAMAVAANIDYHVWKKWAGAMLGITFLLLISVFLFSSGEINGAHRWIVLGGLSFQPSELAKLTFIIYASAWLVERRDRINSLTETFLPFAGVLAAIAVLMLKQPDFGTLMIIVVAAISVYYAAGLSIRQMLIGAAVGVLGISILIASSSYMRDRVETFLSQGSQSSDQTASQTANSYHVENIDIAIGSGGLFGRGFGNSKQKLRYLPEPQTDSIFAIISEELGFFWAEVLILAYLVLIYRGYMIAVRAPDMFGRLVGTGITSWFGFQAAINLGSMVQVVPLVGVPLPFISYGGTNLIISLLAIGVLLNISRFGKDEVPDSAPAARRASRRTAQHA